MSASRADPRVHHRTFSHVLCQNFSSEAAHDTPSHRLRFAEPPHALSRATRGLGVPSPLYSSPSRHCAWRSQSDPRAVVGMVVDTAVPRVVHFCASLELPRRWSLCFEGLHANGVLHLSSGFALLGFPRSCTRLLWIVVFPSSSESSDQSEYGYDRPAAVPAASCLGLALSASASGARSRRSSVRVVSTLASAYDTRSRSCPHCVLAVCLVVSGHLAHPAPRPVAAREYLHREALKEDLVLPELLVPSCSSRSCHKE